MDTDRRLIDFLKDPSSYPERPGHIHHVETHISHVFVGDRFAYKIKKPVDFGFLDFTALPKRRFFCLQEVLVNSVLAGDVYLGMRPIYARNDDFSFSPKRGSKVVEYAVRMKTVPSELLLSSLIDKGQLLYGRLQPVGGLLGKFHRDAMPYRGRAYGGLKAVITNTEENFEQIKPFLGDLVDPAFYHRLVGSTRDFIEKNGGLLRERKQQGFVKDCHGDLHAQHVCLTRPPVVLDRIEFTRRFRIADVLEDIAFLFMDLEFRGRFDLSTALSGSYFKGDGGYDGELLRFYKIYRAVVRAKIEGFASLGLEDGGAKRAARRRAAEYYTLAEAYLDLQTERFNPVVFMGLSGSGKSAIARGLLPEAAYLGSDEIRKSLLGLPKGKHIYVGYGTSIYDQETTDRVYRTLTERAVALASQGRRVVLDATYHRSAYRRELLTACAAARVNPYFVYCFAPADILKERISGRVARGSDISDAHVGVLEEQVRKEEKPDEVPFFRLMRIDTRENLTSIRKALRLFL